MNILFWNHMLHKRSGEGSRTHFAAVASGLARRGHGIFLPRVDFGYCDCAKGWISGRNSWRAISLDILYCRVEGRPFDWPGFIRQSRLRSWLRSHRNMKIVWEINSAPDLNAFNGRYVSPHILYMLEQGLKDMAQHVDMAICNTDGLARYASDLNINNSRVIELGSHPERVPRATRHEPWLNVCWIAGNSLVVWHDLETLATAARMLEGRKNIRFHIFGDIDAKRLPQNVQVHGCIDRAELVTRLSRMDVGLALYKQGSWSRYGVFSSPLKVFDYMAAGLHVVASPIEQIMKLVEQKAYMQVVPYEDPSELSEYLIRLDKHSEAFRAGCERNRDLISSYYNWDRVVDDTEQSLHRVRCTEKV